MAVWRDVPSMTSLLRLGRIALLDVAIRAHVVSYRPLRWKPQRWASVYRNPSLGYLEGLEERSRYSVLRGYLDLVGPGARVLDVGCGSALLCEAAAGVPFERWVGIDLSPDALETARTRVGTDPRTSFRLAGAADDLGTFDVVVCNEVLYFVEDPEAYVARLRGWLAPGGSLLTSMYRHPGDRVLWRLLDRELERVDACDVRNRGHLIAPRGWRVAWHRA